VSLVVSLIFILIILKLDFIELYFVFFKCVCLSYYHSQKPCIRNIAAITEKNLLLCTFLVKSRYLCHHIQNLILHMLKETPIIIL